jgi:hypothetical protein
MRHTLALVLRELYRRVEPFLDLLDARFLPLLFVYSPQAYTVYAWLLRDGTPREIAILGGLGFEFVSVGAIAWAVRGAGWHAARLPAITALVFSAAVAVTYYQPTAGWLAALHAGFPLVGYAYTVMMHAPARAVAAHVAPVAAPQTEQSESGVARVAPDDGTEWITYNGQRYTLAQLVEATGTSSGTLRRKLAQTAQAAAPTAAD